MTAFTIDEATTLSSLDDIIRRPHYLAEVHLKKKVRSRIVALYSFSREQARCGMQSCQQLHGNGFLVAIGKEDEVSLCENCGATLLQTTFEKQQAAISAQDRIRERKVHLNAILEQEESIKDRVNTLKQEPNGANWLYRSLENFRKFYPADLLAALVELADNKNDNRVIESDADPIRIDAIGKLQGLEIFTTDIKEALIGNVLKPLKALVDCANNPDASPASLASHCKWSATLTEHFTLAESLIEQGRIFFTIENMQYLTNIPVSEKSAKRLKSLRWDCENASVMGKK